jgi:hypothetical protein
LNVPDKKLRELESALSVLLRDLGALTCRVGELCSELETICSKCKEPKPALPEILFEELYPDEEE